MTGRNEQAVMNGRGASFADFYYFSFFYFTGVCLSAGEVSV